MPQIEELDDDSEKKRGDKLGADGDGADAAKIILSTLRHHDDDDHDDELFHHSTLSELDDRGFEDDDEEADETLAERLLGLTEMFPDTLRNVVSRTLLSSWSGTKWLYHVARVGVWVTASSAVILALPVMFESERLQMEEQQIMQQRQMLLGPNAAMSGSHIGGGLMPPMPHMAPPPASR